MFFSFVSITARSPFVRLIIAAAVMLAAASISYAASIGGDVTIDTDRKAPSGGELKKDIDDFSDSVILRPYLIIPVQMLEIHHYDTVGFKNSRSIFYIPNPMLCGGSGISYKMVGLAAHSGLTNMMNKNIYGSTRFMDFQFNFYFRKFGADAFYQNYKGFFLNSPGTFLYMKGTPFTKRADLKMVTMGSNLFYVFSDRYSFDASFKQSERQNVSGGSFLLMLSTTNNRIHSYFSLIPVKEEILYAGNAGFKKGSFTSIGLSPGYAHTFVSDNFFISPAIFLGTGVMIKSYITYSGKKNKKGAFIKGNFRIGMGLNEDRYFYGISIILNTNASQNFLTRKGISSTTMGGYVESYGGYRL
ncbi:MAG: DUF4421 domain-containing protein [Spirochaetes bacterium]|jgi:hypothetical protein|nr:DUF4421 domain-containing protein [Spirochaetota bacterium]